MEKYLKELIDKKGLGEARKECVHMIESLMHTCSCYKSDAEKLKDIKSLLGIIEEAEIGGMQNVYEFC